MNLSKGDHLKNAWVLGRRKASNYKELPTDCSYVDAHLLLQGRALGWCLKRTKKKKERKKNYLQLTAKWVDHFLKRASSGSSIKKNVNIHIKSEAIGKIGLELAQLHPIYTFEYSKKYHCKQLAFFVCVLYFEITKARGYCETNKSPMKRNDPFRSLQRINLHYISSLFCELCLVHEVLWVCHVSA